MGEVVQLRAWRRTRGTADRPALVPVRSVGEPRSEPTPDRPEDEARLSLAVERLDRATSRILGAQGRLGPDVDTQLLALLGALAAGLVAEAAERAERLAARLNPSSGAGP